MKKFKIGIAGYGKMGKIRLNSILRSKNAIPVAIFDINKYDQIDEKIQICKSYDELLKTDAEAIIVSTYVKFAAQYVIRALEADKHVLCEKTSFYEF